MGMNSFSQSSPVWESLGNKGGLDFQYSILDCESGKYVALKVRNITGLDPAFELFDLVINQGEEEYIYSINYRELKEQDSSAREWTGDCDGDLLSFSIPADISVQVRIKLPHEN